MTNPERRLSAPATSDNPLRLLIIDDDDNYRAFVAALTRRLGFWVDTASDGEAGLQRLRNAAYDIAIIDHEMPRLSGIGLIKELRADERTKPLYAMMLTAREDVGTKLTALDAGFDDFLTKASSEAEIVAKLVAARRLASRHRTLDMAARDLYGLATRDDLTGTFNRRFFISEAERLLAEGAALNVVLLDVDEFKHVNDAYGHLAGDAVLRDVGTALLSNTRTDDVVARFGGDEFVVGIPHLEVDVIERIARRLERAVAELQWTAGTAAFRVGVSSGYASSRLLEKPTLAQLLNAADRDMYKNKWMRKNPELRPELYEYPAGDRDVVERLLEIAKPAPEPKAIAEPPAGRILIADDDTAIRRLFETLAKRQGIECDAVSNGAEAVAALKQRQYALMFLDLMMPRIDGWGVLDFMRTHAARVPMLFIVTAFLDQTLSAADSEIVSGILYKPVDADEIAALMRQCARGKTPSGVLRNTRHRLIAAAG